ncbi:MAG: beta-galactosidase [Syntrophothermus sp.]
MYRLLLISIIIFILSIPASAQKPDNIITGTVYNIFHEEYATDSDFFEQADKDIALMKKSNITDVMIFPMSQWDTKSKSLRWTRTDYLIKKISEAGMKFIPIMLKEQQCSYYFPVWKMRESEKLWNSRNKNNGNKNSREDIDFADPEIYPVLEEYFKAVAERYGKNPALNFYNIWNEPHYTSDAGHVIEQYKKWLKEKYGNLDKLNRSWGEDYTDWNQVSPFMNDNWNSSMPQIDYTTFMNEMNGLLLGRLVKTLRKYDTVHAVNSNPVGAMYTNSSNFGGFSQDNFVFTKYNDINGLSYYPDAWERGHGLDKIPYYMHSLAFNTVRSASLDKNYILTELFTNAQNGLALNGYLTYNDLNLISWTALANDCKGIVYWKWEPFMRGRQSLGRGLCDLTGELAPRGEAVKDFGRVMSEYGKNLFNAHPLKAQSAIMMDMTGLLKTLEQSTEPATQKFMYDSNAGLFKALYDAGIQVDFLRSDMMLTLNQLKQYKIIFLPFQIVMRKETADLLKEYVKQGGYISADARTAVIDELDFAYKVNPGAGLDEVFGASRKDWTAAKKYFMVDVPGKPGQKSYSFGGKYFREHLITGSSAEVLAKYADTQEPAIISNRYGKGTAVLAGIPLGASYFENDSNPANRFLVSLAEEAGVKPDAVFESENNSFLNIRVHSSKDEQVIYIINSDGINKSGSVSFSPEIKVKSMKDIVSGSEVKFEERDGKIIFPVSMKANSVMVVLAN